MSSARPQTKERIYIYSFCFRRYEFESRMVAEELRNALAAAKHPFTPPRCFKHFVLPTVADEEVTAPGEEHALTYLAQIGRQADRRKALVHP